MEEVSLRILKNFSEFDNHTKVVHVMRRDVGLDGFIAIHRECQGCSIGGTRFFEYLSPHDALRDALRLSKAMTYKCAMAGIALGGGKGVLMKPRYSFDRSALLHAYTEALNELKDFYTGEDVGMTQDDAATMAAHSPYIVGKPGMGGDPGPWAALSVYYAILTALEEVYGEKNVRGKKFAVKGLGNVGSKIAKLLLRDGGIIFGADIDEVTIRRIRKNIPEVHIVSPEEIHTIPVDVYIPCALGGEFDVAKVEKLACRIVCGGANNQLASPEVGRLLAKRGIWYVPDYVANAGGLINVAAELHPKGYQEDRVRVHVKEVSRIVRKILRASREDGNPPGEIADAIAEAAFSEYFVNTVSEDYICTKENYRAWQVHPKDFPCDASWSEKLLFLVRFAILAPSSHNCQPWYFVVKEKKILLKPDFSRALPVSDIHNRHLYFALGCALENLLIAADYYGFKAHVSYFPDTDTAAMVSFSGEQRIPSEYIRDHLIFSIPRRMMNRAPYDRRMPNSSFFEIVRKLSVPPLEFCIITNDIQKRTLTEILLSFRYRAFDDGEFREELSSYKRTNLTRKFLGMPGFTMGFNTPFSLIAPSLIRRMNVMRFIQNTDRKMLTMHTPVFIVVATHQEDEFHWLQSGKAAERMMLEAERSGIAVAGSAMPHESGVFRDLFPSSVYPQLFFRVGHTSHTSGHSPRLPAERVSTVFPF
ncbi:MAG: hypothetical protein NUV53_00080 [Patescibacteria group bacterium]|nr:hypothetical protein [Patescibacteria group bacterium]